MEDEKYVVFKREDWQRIKLKVLHPTAAALVAREGIMDEASHRALDDAVVIRTQDVFAASGLAAYAANIRTYIALRGPVAQLAQKGLGQIASYFESVAQEAADRRSRGEAKVPD